MDLPDRNQKLSTCGVVNKTNKEKGTECYVYANFDGGWDQANADNAEDFMLSTDYVITYAGCPVLWCIKLQMATAFSTTEGEYIA